MLSKCYNFLMLLVLVSLIFSCKSDDDPIGPIGTPGTQELYFPPLAGTWETTSPEALSWDENRIQELRTFLESTNTKAFILLKDGRIVIENYFDGFTAGDAWPWFSAGKTLSAFLAGTIEDLNLDTPTESFLGTGWTATTADQQSTITLRHQLTMTTGLDDGVTDPFCTDPECLQFLAEPGTRWAYHNGPYTLITSVIEAATGTTLNAYTNATITATTGIQGAWGDVGFNKIFFSNARSMARFGLLLLAEGRWNNQQLLSDPGFHNLMIFPSQDINPAYGYLTWLNGSSRFMVPGLQASINGSIAPSAPADLYAAMGRNGQLINVVPSQGLVMIRLGDNPDNSLVPFTYQEEIWQRLSLVF